ncbi:MAG: winged helix-turn-helix domain-containing protein [Flavobacteriales bacterium]
MAFAPLDPLLHNQLRLAIMSSLMAVDEGDFNFLLERTGATRGNLSAQLAKLREAGYISMAKGFKGSYPHTVCAVTWRGIKAFEDYVAALRKYVGG